MLFMHGSSYLLHEEAIHFYHNTCLLRSISFAAATMHFMTPEAPRRAFNNLFLYAQEKSRERGLHLRNTEKLDLQMDGNLHWNIRTGGASSQAYLDALRKLPTSERTRKGCSDGLGAHSLVIDPKCVNVGWDRTAVNDYRLRENSPAVRRGLVLPKEYEDPLRPKDGERPDIGAVPLGGEQLRAGIQGRIIAGVLP